MDVAIIDSGIMTQHPALKEAEIDGCAISITPNGNVNIDADYSDNLGHGTAVSVVLSRHAKKAKLHMIKIFTDELWAEPEHLIAALIYVRDNLACPIIHMSLGSRVPDSRLYNVCKQLYDQGRILVAAFDNAGAISFPAAYNFVIGVDASPRCKRSEDFVVVQDDMVNIRAKGGVQRVAWINPNYILQGGSSFAAPYVTAKIVQFLESGIRREELMSAFCEHAKYVYPPPSTKQMSTAYSATRKSIERAAIFPYNKEMHALINHVDLLSFEITGVFDDTQFGRLGRIARSLDGRFQYPINSIDCLDYSTIDTLIIGHVFEMEAHKGKDIKAVLLEKCLNSGTNAYCYDDECFDRYQKAFFERGLDLFAPSLLDTAGEENLVSYSKLYQFRTPIIGVFGTSSQQGKYNLQLGMKKALSKMGYHVAHLGTEPSAMLLGANEIFHYGYSAKHLPADYILHSVNRIMHRIDQKEFDIIIAGAQSGIVPIRYDNMGQMTQQQLAFLLGIRPDAVVVCINYDDSVHDIIRAIQAIEGIADTRVIALYMFPLSFQSEWQIATNRRVSISAEQISLRCAEVTKATGITVVSGGDSNSYQKICDQCIDYLAS